MNTAQIQTTQPISEPYDAIKVFGAHREFFNGLTTFMQNACHEEETAPGAYERLTGASLARFMDITGVAIPTALDQVVEAARIVEKTIRTFYWHLAEIAKCQLPVLEHEVRPASDAGPAHYAPPSGLETRAVFTICLASEPVGKRPFVNSRGGIVKAVHAAQIGVKLTGNKAEDPSVFSTWHTMISVGVSDFSDLAYWAQFAAKAEKAYVVRGLMADDLAPMARGVRRGLAPEPKHKALGKLFRSGLSGKAGAVLLADLEKMDLPADFDHRDIDQLEAQARAVLPQEFHDAAFILTVTGSHGVAIKEGKNAGKHDVRLRVLALASRPLTVEEGKDWFDVPGSDPAMWNKVHQPCFVSRHCVSHVDPKVKVEDPFADLLWTYCRGDSEIVQVPDFVEPDAATPANDDMAWGVGVAASSADFTFREELELFGLRRRFARAADARSKARLEALETRPDVAVALVNAWRKDAAQEAALDAVRTYSRRKGGAVVKGGKGGAFAGLTAAQIAAKVGDHEGGKGFYEPMWPLAFRLWIEGGVFTDERADEIEAQMRSVYEAADTGDRPSDYFEQNYAWRLRHDGVDAARRAAEQWAAEGERSDGAGFAVIDDDEVDALTEAAHAALEPLPHLSLAQAQERLRDGARLADEVMAKLPFDPQGGASFGLVNEDEETGPFWEALALVQGADWGDDLFVRLVSAKAMIAALDSFKGLTEAEHEMLPKEVSRRARFAGRRVLSLRAGAGIGKTRTVIDTINADTALAPADRSRPRFGVASPDTALADQTAKGLDGAGLYAGIDKGCIDSGPLGPSHLRNIAARQGFSQDFHCKTRCEHYAPGEAQCGFWRQAETLKGVVVPCWPNGVGAMLQPLGKPAVMAGWVAPEIVANDEGTLAERIREGELDLNSVYDFQER